MSDRWEGLRRLAAQATPGPWTLATSCSFRRYVSDHPQHWGGVCEPIVQRHDGHPDLHFRNGGQDGPDAKWITAANPSAIADLLAERDHLERELAEARRDAACFRFWVSEAARNPGNMAKLIANCTTEDEYRAAILPCVHGADDAIGKAMGTEPAAEAWPEGMG